MTGGAPVDNVQYELIRKQFECMAGYLSWEVLFFKTYSANAKDELEKNTEAMEELENWDFPDGVVGEILPKQEKAVIIQ